MKTPEEIIAEAKRRIAVEENTEILRVAWAVVRLEPLLEPAVNDGAIKTDDILFILLQSKLSYLGMLDKVDAGEMPYTDVAAAHDRMFNLASACSEWITWITEREN